MRSFPNKLKREPFQAVECGLARVAPLDPNVGWTIESGDALIDMTRNEMNDMLSLKATVSGLLQFMLMLNDFI